MDRRGSYPVEIDGSNVYKKIKCPFSVQGRRRFSYNSDNWSSADQVNFCSPVNNLAFEDINLLPNSRRGSSCESITRLSPTLSRKRKDGTTKRYMQTTRQTRKFSSKTPKLGAFVFCQALPFHIVFDERMAIVQAGFGVLKLMNIRSINGVKYSSLKNGAKLSTTEREYTFFNDYFKIKLPESAEEDCSTPNCMFSWIKNNLNSSFTIQLKRLEGKIQQLAEDEVHIILVNTRWFICRRRGNIRFRPVVHVLCNSAHAQSISGSKR